MCGEGEHATEITKEWRTARKEHKCYACHEPIRPRDRYHITVQVDDDFGVFKHCARCWAICLALWHAGADWVQYDLNCGVAWEENFGDLPDAVAALAFLTPDEAQKLPEIELE